MLFLAPPNIGPAFLLDTRSPGTYVSDLLCTDLGAFNNMLFVFANDFTDDATLDVSFEESTDQETWTAVPAGAIPQMSAVGNAWAFVAIDLTHYVRVTSTVSGGETASVTYTVVVMVFDGVIGDPPPLAHAATRKKSH